MFPDPKDFKLEYNFDTPEWKKYDKTRSYEQITYSDLRKLLNLTLKDHKQFLNKNPKYRNLKILSICLCQGGALHYIDKKTGVRDFDVYIFFDDRSTVRYPVRRKGFADFGKSKFGKCMIHKKNLPKKYYDSKGKFIEINLDFFSMFVIIRE